DNISVSTTAPTGNVVVSSPFTIGESNVTPIYVTVSTKGGSTVSYRFDPSNINRIYIEAGAGNDNLRIGTDVKIKATLIGGKGNDTLIGGPLGDVLSGGDGNDSLEAADIQFVFNLTPVPAKTQPIGGKLFIPGERQPV